MKQVANYSNLRADVVLAIKKTDAIWDEGLKQFSKEKSIPIDILHQKLETKDDPLFIVGIMRYIDDYTQNVIPRPNDVAFQKEQIGTIHVEWIKAPNAPNFPIILYFHGGGYVFGGLDASWQIPSQLSRIANVNILSVNYSHAPENPYPAALDDAVSMYEYLITSQSVDPKKIVVSGSSAGGGLALALLLKLRDENKPLPAGAVLFSPWTDLTFSGNSLETNKQKDPELLESDLRTLASIYGGSTRKCKLPYISPVFGDFQGFPPLLVDAGEIEILRDDSARLVENAQEAGVEIHYKEWKDMPHVFHYLYAHIPEPNQAFQRVADFLKKVIN